MATLSQIWLYPIKSLDGLQVQEREILSGGALASDREWAIFDAQGRYVHAKREPRIHQIRTNYDLPNRQIQVRSAGSSATFHLDQEQPALAQWLSDFFGYGVTLQQNIHTGFPDDLGAPGPTIVSLATLEVVAQWYELSVAEIRARFRANLEISDTSAFWEDQLFNADTNTVRPFQIGGVQLLGINPCNRCVVPTRQPETGQITAQFQQQFSQQRAAHLPNWAPQERFKHFYKLSTNTRVAPSECGKVLKVGDEVVL